MKMWKILNYNMLRRTKMIRTRAYTSDYEFYEILRGYESTL